MVFRRYQLRLAGRFLLVLLAMFATVWFAIQPGYHGLTLITSSILALSVLVTWHLINQTN